MATTLQTTFANSFPWTKIVVFFVYNYHCILIKISLKYVTTGSEVSIGSDNGLVPNRWQAIIWMNDILVY